MLTNISLSWADFTTLPAKQHTPKALYTNTQDYRSLTLVDGHYDSHAHHQYCRTRNLNLIYRNSSRVRYACIYRNRWLRRRNVNVFSLRTNLRRQRTGYPPLTSLRLHPPLLLLRHPLHLLHGQSVVDPPSVASSQELPRPLRAFLFQSRGGRPPAQCAMRLLYLRHHRLCSDHLWLKNPPKTDHGSRQPKFQSNRTNARSSLCIYFKEQPRRNGERAARLRIRRTRPALSRSGLQIPLLPRISVPIPVSTPVSPVWLLRSMTLISPKSSSSPS